MEAGIEEPAVEGTAEPEGPSLENRVEEDWRSPTGPHCNNRVCWDRYEVPKAESILTRPGSTKNGPYAHSVGTGEESGPRERKGPPCVQDSVSEYSYQ